MTNTNTTNYRVSTYFSTNGVNFTEIRDDFADYKNAEEFATAQVDALKNTEFYSYTVIWHLDNIYKNHNITTLFN